MNDLKRLVYDLMQKRTSARDGGNRADHFSGIAESL